ncbi:sodium:proton antiporter [Lactiplantibacillus paraplantarum]|uniref:sodium:proton antiporter n=1 Tax=Lactiplantibacillus paraplantarum TaxID=60520 RepID=UPI0020749F83|nr:sodium:proton antiporter [Lactiplantibacillus paraplantarum]
MLSLGIQPGLIASQTIVINDVLSYQVRLRKLRVGHAPFQLKIIATTTLGRLTVMNLGYHDLLTARTAFNHQLHQLEPR